MPGRGPFPCPNCGEEVPAGAKACPGCGSDETTGWSHDTIYDGADIPDAEEMDYDKILENEGLARPKHRKEKIGVILVIIVLIVAFLLAYAFG